MPNLRNLLNSHIPGDAFTDRLEKEGCHVPLEGAAQPDGIIDMDHQSLNLAGKRRCDYIFICREYRAEVSLVSPLELKAGSPRASQVIDQLQAGADFVRDKVCDEERIMFRPALAYGGKLHKDQRKRLFAGRISFRGAGHLIEIIKCGAPLKSLFPPSA